MPRKKKEEPVVEGTEIAVSTTSRKVASTKKEGTSSKKTTSVKKTTTKSNTKKSTSSKTTTKKDVSSTKSSKKSSEKETTSIDTSELHKKSTPVEVAEYYDLPYRYNQTIVKVLYQTPTTLFVYWDISDEDRENFINQYGDNFFNDTKPVLIVKNDTLHYSFEVDIDDFANNWYVHVNDSNSVYSVELGRRAKETDNNYVYVASSNEIEAPNDHVLFNKNLNKINFKNVKTNTITTEDASSLSYSRNIDKIYKSYFNKDDHMNLEHCQLDLANSSSSSPTSAFK